MFNACKRCNHADHVPDDLSKWTKFRTLQLVFLCHVFVMYQRCSISASFEWFRFPKRTVFYLFLSMGAQAQVSFSSLNFDVIRTKEAEMEPVYITCSGRGETELKVFFRVKAFLNFKSFRILQFVYRFFLNKFDKNNSQNSIGVQINMKT